MVQQLTQMKRRAGMWRWESGSVQRQWTRGMSTTILPETVVANLRSCTTTTHTVSFLIPFPHSRSRHQLHKIRHTCAVETTNHHRLQNLNLQNRSFNNIRISAWSAAAPLNYFGDSRSARDAHPVSASRLNLHSSENVSWGLFPLQHKYTKSQVWSARRAVFVCVSIYEYQLLDPSGLIRTDHLYSAN
jgi:hypothetical protein